MPTSTCKFPKNVIPLLPVRVLIVTNVASVECFCGFFVEEKPIDRLAVSDELYRIRHTFAVTRN
jgi:hypothetical protein